jgi:hypothetical protein
MSVKRAAFEEMSGALLKDVLERVAAALPHIRTWMMDLRAQHAGRGFPVRQFGFANLAKVLPSRWLEKTRVVIVETTPFPPVSACGLPEFQNMAATRWEAIAFDDVYFVKRGYEDFEAIHFHELIHVIQWATLDADAFLLTYATGLVRYDYENGPLERVAYDLHAAFMRDTLPPDLIGHIVRRTHEAYTATIQVWRAAGVRLPGE